MTLQLDSLAKSIAAPAEALETEARSRRDLFWQGAKADLREPA